MSKDFFLKRYKEFGHALKGTEKTRRALRVNTLKISAEEIKKKLEKLGAKVSKIDFVKNGFYIEKTDFSLGASFEYLFGMFSMQEAAAQFAAEVLDVSSSDIVLDMCAAPGGKTCQIAAMMENKGAIVAVDLKRDRVYALENNLERCGVVNCAVYCDDTKKMSFGDVLFDRILLDAPCSGNYVTDYDWFKKRDIEGIKFNAQKQRELLMAAMRLLKKDGILVYTTCSLEPEENELNMQWLSENYKVRFEKINGPGSAALISVLGQELDKQIANCRRFWPNETHTQGFFAAKIVKQ
jgi:NOL1/NOP2/sun family putative RNA methylase